jgi:hypothetical protein
MVDNNRRPEDPICGDADKQEDRDHDRRNEVFHGSFLLKDPSAGGESGASPGKAACPQNSSKRRAMAQIVR